MLAFALSLSQLGIVCTVVAAVTGLLFYGAAAAWRSERDAERDKAERLAVEVAKQAGEIEALKRQVKELERRPNVDQLAEVTREIVAALVEVKAGLHANTTAIEFLVKQMMPPTDQAAA